MDGIPLDKIEVVSTRIRSLLARTESVFVEENFIQLEGIVDIARGLEYHHLNALALLKMEQDSLQHIESVKHEVVAWLNRVGQFYYFSQSALVKSVQLKMEMPTINLVLPLRHKYSAHRAIDAPRKSDTADQLPYQALAFSSLVGSQWVAREPKKPEQGEFSMIESYYLVFELQHGEGDVARLNIECDHAKVMSEIFTCISRLCA
jgi:hypothetical protein